MWRLSNAFKYLPVRVTSAQSSVLYLVEHRGNSEIVIGSIRLSCSVAAKSCGVSAGQLLLDRMDTLRIDISVLISAAQDRLLGSAPCLIDYVDREALEKNVLPPSLGKTPINVYALWRRGGSEDKWELMYIGQRSHESGWSRVAQHLFSTPRGTQSKLQEVRGAIKSGAPIGVTAILVEPDSMRLSVEEELINRNSSSDSHLLWNRKARAKVPKRRRADSAI